MTLVVSEVPPPPQVGHVCSSVILPVPWHRGHVTEADAKFKTEKRRMAIIGTVNALFFMSYFSPSARISFQLATLPYYTLILMKMPHHQHRQKRNRALTKKPC
jgi:hypothetical protein